MTGTRPSRAERLAEFFDDRARLSPHDATGRSPRRDAASPPTLGANTAADHIDAFETALDQLAGVEPEQRLVRADSAGATQAFLGYLAQTGVDFSIGARLESRCVSPAPR